MAENKIKYPNFKEDLRFSEDASCEPFWQQVYQKAFPDMLFATLCKGKSQGQYLGIDRTIQLQSGKTIHIDEKKRRENWPDIALEIISNDVSGSPGWMEKDLLIDYLAYAFIRSQCCYLFPWLLLKRTWNNFKFKWKKEYRRIESQNYDEYRIPIYKTISVAIPTDVLLSEIKNCMTIQLQGTTTK